MGTFRPELKRLKPFTYEPNLPMVRSPNWWARFFIGKGIFSDLVHSRP